MSILPCSLLAQGWGEEMHVFIVAYFLSDCVSWKTDSSCNVLWTSSSMASNCCRVLKVRLPVEDADEADELDLEEAEDDDDLLCKRETSVDVK